MCYQLISIFLSAIFYGFYFAKLLLQRKQSIKTNQMGKGNKPRRVLIIERVVSAATVLAFIAGISSIFLVKQFLRTEFRIAGIVTGIIAVIFFGLAALTMKNSWRVGIPEEKTSLITKGIYKWSRNPAFLGFDLLYLSVCLIFFNIPLMLISVWAAVMLHLQILQEEEHMHRMFGEAYDRYKEHTLRYFGIKQ